MSDLIERAKFREQLEATWDAEERWEGDFVRPSEVVRERMIDAATTIPTKEKTDV